MTWYFDAMGGYRPCCVTRTFKYLSDPQAVVASVEEVLAIGFDRYVPAHGLIIEHGAQEAMRAGTLEMFTEFCQPCAPRKGPSWMVVVAVAAGAAVGLAIAVARGRSGTLPS